MSDEPKTHWMDIQELTFTRWCNKYLKKRGMHIEKMEHDFKDGIKLVNLVEVISGDQKVGRLNKHPRVPAQKLENVGMALTFVKNEGIKLVNIGPEDIVDGRLKLILGLIWTLILRYQIQKGNKSEGDSAENDLLKWVNSKVNPTYQVKNFKGDWNDGKVLNALIDALRPGVSPNHESMDPNEKVKNCAEGIDKAESDLGVEPLILANELANPKVDSKAVMAYVSQFRDLGDFEPKVIDNTLLYASQAFAYGPGLQEGVENVIGEFTVETPTEDDVGELTIHVEGPSMPIDPVITKIADGKYDVKYTPDCVGVWKIHVKLADVHIPGSIFEVEVLEDESMGGEGKIRVFYSTTSSTDKGRTDNKNLMKLLELKKIHEREDFEPWIPVDILEREDRELLFRKAGSRTLPICVIDDIVVGGYEAVLALSETGTLDKILVKGINGAGKEYLQDKVVMASEEAA